MPDSLRTPRLRLRPPLMDDAEAIFTGWASDPRASRYLTWRPHEDVARTRAFLTEALEGARRGERRLFAIERREGGALIGLVDAHLELCRTQLGYVLAPAAWGHGFMSEAVRAVTGLLLAEPPIFRIWAVADVENRASARVMEKAGMQFEGRLRRWILHPNIAREPRDVLCYARVR